MPTPTNATVQVTYITGSAESLTVDPATPSIWTTGEVSWVISVPAGMTAEVDFQGQGQDKGPFPKTSNSHNPDRGVYKGGNGEHIASGGPDKLKDPSKVWKYDVIIRQDGRPVARIDPGVIIGGPP